MMAHRNEELIKIYNDKAELRASIVSSEGEDGESRVEMVVEGYAVVFDSPTVIHDFWDGDFTEIISRGALDNTDMTDVGLFFNHDTYGHAPMARSRKGKGTLELSVDNVGLKVRSVLDGSNPLSQEVYSAVSRGDITGMSFMFRVKSGGDNWTGLSTDHPVRTINDISIIHEVSIVNYPAYEATSIHARAKDEGKQTSPLAEARKAVRALELEKEKSKTYLI